MTIRNWPEAERPREKLLSQGAHSLSTAELIAALFGTGTHEKSALAVAQEALIHFGSLRKLVAANLSEFSQLHGLGKVKFVQLQSTLELSRRFIFESLQHGEQLSNPNDVRNYLISQLRHKEHETFACIFLDNQHRIISFQEMFQGTVNSTNVYPREIIKRALSINATAVICAHNHPSGNAQPSKQDQILTQILTKALKLVDIELLDHFVVGDGELTSFAQMGLLKEPC